MLSNEFEERLNVGTAEYEDKLKKSFLKSAGGIGNGGGKPGVVLFLYILSSSASDSFEFL